MIKTLLFCLGGKKGTTLFFHLSYLILLSKIQCNNSLQSTSEQHQQQKNMCFNQNITMSLYKKWIELFPAVKNQETHRFFTVDKNLSFKFQ